MTMTSAQSLYDKIVLPYIESFQSYIESFLKFAQASNPTSIYLLLVIMLVGLLLTFAPLFSRKESVSMKTKLYDALATSIITLIVIALWFVSMTYQIKPIQAQDEATPVEQAFIMHDAREVDAKSGIHIYEKSDENKDLKFISDVDHVKDTSDLKSGDRIQYKQYQAKGQSFMHIISRNKHQVSDVNRDDKKDKSMKVKDVKRQSSQVIKINDRNINDLKFQKDTVRNRNILNQVQPKDKIEYTVLHEENNISKTDYINIKAIKRDGETIEK